MPLNAPWMDYVFRLHLRQMLRNEAVTLQERASGRGDERTAAIAFADLVGFTELGQTVDVAELSDVAGNLQRMAGELVDPPVRLVKVIGDAVMLVVAASRSELVDTTIRLVERAEATGRLPAAARRASPSARPPTTSATGSARRSTSPAGSPRARGRAPCSSRRRCATRSTATATRSPRPARSA